ncbi:CsgE family curli-type amyloid fiber assembly protein [Aquimarina sp. 2201CG5-10]|uniref:CsgE family curli-type amyloid fiber assembly protein n=1 Tax=Aquimarina callyspongiae TaxID=3098150 RepID=UPI002AB47F1E|nr:CsgE family curli-type amyloid fiber assembly protein [Aquimarina sp. 2201CG5-10]MDY8134291.1 CsgE family curli-type amyloid fiber assembly protein [Aquimarina sp. 2201CG5-10]
MKCRLIILFTIIFQVATAQFTNIEVVAKIKTTSIDNVITVVATATNTTEVHKSLKYVFSVFRTDAQNKLLKSSRDGRFTLEANERKELSKAFINVEKNDKIVVLLLVYEEDEIIGKHRIAFNENTTKESETEEESLNDGIELRGIVIEETKTKPGRDFYEFFYNSYSLNQINGSKVVGVYEKLSFGRTTIIQVKISDNVIHEFIGKPDLEYLEQMSKVAIRKVFKYFKDLKNQKKDIIQY